MPRLARNQIKTKFFHNMTQGINKEYIFQDERCKKKYMKYLEKDADKFNIKIIAFTIMDNHTHILVYTDEIDNMSLFMKSINEKFAMFYNYTNNRVGVVFRGRYKSQPILCEKHLENCIKYIFNNPVRAGIVSKPEEYLYSNLKEFKISKILENVKNQIEEKDINSFVKNHEERFVANNEFIDICEDKEIFIKEFIRQYEKKNGLGVCRNRKELEKMVKEIKKETNITNKILASILQLSTSTIRNYLKDER